MKYLKAVILIVVTVLIYIYFFKFININSLYSFPIVITFILAIVGTGLVFWVFYSTADLVSRVQIMNSSDNDEEESELTFPSFYLFIKYISFCLSILIIPVAFYTHISSSIENELGEYGKITLGRVVNPQAPIPREGIGVYYITADSQKITNDFKVTKITIRGFSNNGMVPILYSKRYPRIACIMDDENKLKSKYPQLAKLSTLSEILEFARASGINNKLAVLNKENQVWTYESSENDTKKIVFIDRLRSQAFSINSNDTNICFYVSEEDDDEIRLREELLGQGFEAKSTDKDVFYFKYPFIIAFNHNSPLFADATTVLEVNCVQDKVQYEQLAYFINNDKLNELLEVLK